MSGWAETSFRAPRNAPPELRAKMEAVVRRDWAVLSIIWETGDEFDLMFVRWRV
jgi:hypothetical protein